MLALPKFYLLMGLSMPPLGSSVPPSRGWLTGALEAFHPTHPELAQQNLFRPQLYTLSGEGVKGNHCK